MACSLRLTSTIRSVVLLKKLTLLEANSCNLDKPFRILRQNIIIIIIQQTSFNNSISLLSKNGNFLQ